MEGASVYTRDNGTPVVVSCDICRAMKQRPPHALTWRVPGTHDDPPVIGVGLDSVDHLQQQMEDTYYDRDRFAT